MRRTYLRGEMYYADLGHGVGSEQEGHRPVVIVQNDIENKHSPTVIVAAIITRVMGKRELPTHLEIGVEHGTEKIKELNHVLAISVGLIYTQEGRVD